LVDVVETVDWSGANTSSSDTGQGDVLISSSVQGASAFETIFHEASHVLMDRSDPVQQALADAAGAANFEQPNDLWHVVLFYTTGEAVRPILSENGQSPYKTMLYEIYDRGTWVKYREALEKNWQPYIDGKRSLSEAASDLINAVKEQQKSMDITRLKEFATKYTAAWCSQNAASVAEFYAEDGWLKINNGIPSVGRKEITAAAQSFMTAFPDMVVKMDEISVDGNHAIYRWTLTGTNTGPKGTGNAVQISGYEEWTIGSHGLIAESKGHFDEAEYQRQLNKARN
jgi:uncharacterized protein (TIGR02246 family)